MPAMSLPYGLPYIGLLVVNVFKTQLSINLCKQHVPSICHTYDLLAAVPLNFPSRLKVDQNQRNQNAL